MPYTMADNTSFVLYGYLDVAVSDILTVCILEALKDRPENMTDFLLAHVDAVGVRVEVRLGQLHDEVKLGRRLDNTNHLADTRLSEGIKSETTDK